MLFLREPLRYSIIPGSEVPSMDEEIKKGLRKIVRDTENRMAGSLLKWRYTKEGKKIPDEQDIERQSRQVADEARRIITRRGKNILKELKKAYRGMKDEGNGKDETSQ